MITECKQVLTVIFFSSILSLTAKEEIVLVDDVHKEIVELKTDLEHGVDKAKQEASTLEKFEPEQHKIQKTTDKNTVQKNKKKIKKKETVKQPQKQTDIVQKTEPKAKPVQKPQPKTINKIATVIYTDDAPIIITQLDYDRKSLDGVKRPKEQVLFERLLFHEAQHVYRMPLPDDMVDKHLASIREAHGISDNEIAQLFMREGYTFEEGKDQLRMSYAIQSLINSLITSRLVVTEKEIKDFYDNNSVVEPAAFRIQKGFVEKDALTEQQLKDLELTGLYQETVQWAHPYWLELDEIADAKKFITTMKPGQIKTVQDEKGHEVIKLIKSKKEHKKTLDECRRHIADRLKMPKYEAMMKELESDLLKKYEIVELV